MFFPVDSDIETRHSASVEFAVLSIYKTIFPQGDPCVVQKAFAVALDCFNGKYGNYQAIDARYHDLEHTLQGTLCFARMLYGRYEAKAEPPLTQRLFELALHAILLHDTGYLKTHDDTEGTGAKYTLTHVSRSVEFAGILLSERRFSPSDIQSVQNMIRCTGVNLDLKAIPFQSELERVLALCLGTADLLGQMAAKDYIDKLPILFSEFEESARHNQGRGSATGAFGTVRDLMEKTPLFWERYVLPKINGDFQGVYRFLNFPYPDGPNLYLKRIEANIARLHERLASSSV
jgi:hypothetical protein